MKDLFTQIIQDALIDIEISDEEKDQIIQDIMDNIRKETKCLDQKQ